MPDPLAHCLTIDQAAIALGLRPETIRQYARPQRDRRGLPRLRPVPGIRVLLFEPREVKRFAAAKRTPGRPEK